MGLEYGVLQRIFARLLYDEQRRTALSWIRRYGIKLRPSTTDIDQLLDVVVNEPYVLPVSFSPKAIVDIGANVGFASIQLSMGFKDSVVYAYEPEPENFKALEINTKKFPKIFPVQRVVTPFPEQAVGCYNRGGEWGYVFQSIRPENEQDFIAYDTVDADYHTIQTISLNQIVADNHLSPDGENLLKVNIAGFEHELFAGDLSWMDAFGAIAIRVPWPMSPENQAGLHRAFGESGHTFTLRALNTLLLFERADLS